MQERDEENPRKACIRLLEREGGGGKGFGSSGEFSVQSISENSID